MLAGRSSIRKDQVLSAEISAFAHRRVPRDPFDSKPFNLTAGVPSRLPSLPSLTADLESWRVDVGTPHAFRVDLHQPDGTPPAHSSTDLRRTSSSACRSSIEALLPDVA